MTMTKTIEQGMAITQMMCVLDETVEQAYGVHMYLEPGTSLFQTLDTITAEQASQPVGGRCATLAAQVAHVTLYLNVNEHYMLSSVEMEVDWGEIWRTVRAVSPAEWDTLRQQLRDTYHRVIGTMRGFESWDNENKFGNTLAIIVHTAYHLGEIRQALCVLQKD